MNGSSRMSIRLAEDLRADDRHRADAVRRTQDMSTSADAGAARATHTGRAGGTIRAMLAVTLRSLRTATGPRT
jgi:hypothetical protein